MAPSLGCTCRCPLQGAADLPIWKIVSPPGGELASSSKGELATSSKKAPHPFLTPAGAPRSGEEAALRGRALGLLFLGGGVIGQAGVLFGSSRQVHRGLLLVLASLGYPVGLVALRWARRWPEWLLQVVLAGGTLLTGGGIYVGHALALGVAASFFYVWVALYAFHFFSLRWACMQLGLAAASYALVLGIVGGPSAGGEWVIAIGTAAVAGAVMFQVSRQMRAMAATDHLTGLPNRQVLEHALAIEVARAQREASALSLAVIDLDGFKAVNDDLGHAAGDRLLVDYARAWVKALRAGDTLVRYGGDEFVVILPSASLTEAQSIVGRLIDAGPVTASAGIAQFRRGDVPESLLRRADDGLYQAKRNKRGR